jgi:xylitol oxidase
LEDHFETITASADSVSLFTDWQSEGVNQVWLKRRLSDEKPTGQPDQWFGATRATGHRHPIASISPVNCTAQMGVRGPWHERLPHFRMDYTPSSGQELQSEYFVARADALAALRALNPLREQIAALVQISELRTIAADHLWMSPCYGRDSVSIHFTWRKDAQGVARILPRIEEALDPFGPRPHWGKLFAMSPARLQSLYPRLGDFRALLESYDPRGKFRNAFLERYVISRAG